ncbi:MAG TPA: UDP-glucose 4-epimerase GalE, partial [Sphingopyxis sp.]
LEVLDALEGVTARPIAREMKPRRAGDPPVLIADPTKAMRELGWKAERSDIDTIVRTALAWHQQSKVPA